jgi:hypothetical protein
MNRAQRRASQHKRGTIRNLYHIDPVAGLRLLDHARPYEPGEMIAEHNLTRAAFERLRTGCGDEADFDRVSMVFNIALMRAEDIDPLLVETMTRGQMAFVRMKDRYLRGLPFGFDAQGLQDVPDALDAYQVMVDASSPLQMRLAINEAYRRIMDGDLLEVAG